MATEFTVILRDTPGSLASLGQALGEALVNIEAIQMITRGGEGFRQALDSGRFPHREREILVVRVLDEPGALGSGGARHGHGGHQHRYGVRRHAAPRATSAAVG